MSYIVDIDKSILTQKVSEQKSIVIKTLNSFPFVGLYLVFIGLTINFFSDFKINAFEIKQFIIFILSVIGLTYLTIGFFTMNKLQKFKISNREEIRKLIFEYLETNEIPIIGRSNRMIIAEKTCGIFSWGKRWVIIFDRETDVYINCRTLGRRRIESPFHSLRDKRRVDDLMKNFT